MNQLPFQKSVSKTCKPLEVIHSDVWGPTPVTSNGGTQFYVIFVVNLPGLLGSILSNVNLKFLLVLYPLLKLCKIYSIIKSKFYILTVEENMQLLIFNPIVLLMEYYINTLARPHLNKMAWLKENIDTLWTLHSH